MYWSLRPKLLSKRAYVEDIPWPRCPEPTSCFNLWPEARVFEAIKRELRRHSAIEPVMAIWQQCADDPCVVLKKQLNIKELSYIPAEPVLCFRTQNCTQPPLPMICVHRGVIQQLLHIPLITWLRCCS